jgi:hypothetical protein
VWCVSAPTVTRLAPHGEKASATAQRCPPIRSRATSVHVRADHTHTVASLPTCESRVGRGVTKRYTDSADRNAIGHTDDEEELSPSALKNTLSLSGERSVGSQLLGRGIVISTEESAWRVLVEEAHLAGGHHVALQMERHALDVVVVAGEQPLRLPGEVVHHSDTRTEVNHVGAARLGRHAPAPPVLRERKNAEFSYPLYEICSRDFTRSCEYS